MTIGRTTYQKYYMPIISRYPNLWGVCVMTFLHIFNRLAIKHKKHISLLDGATYQKYYRLILSTFCNLWNVGIMTFLDISNRLAVKYKKHISPIGGATYRKQYRLILSSYPNVWWVCVMTLIRFPSLWLYSENERSSYHLRFLSLCHHYSISLPTKIRRTKNVKNHKITRFQDVDIYVSKQ